jgi:hypothetical protein
MLIFFFLQGVVNKHPSFVKLYYLLYIPKPESKLGPKIKPRHYFFPNRQIKYYIDQTANFTLPASLLGSWRHLEGPAEAGPNEAAPLVPKRRGAKKKKIYFFTIYLFPQLHTSGDNFLILTFFKIYFYK